MVGTGKRIKKIACGNHHTLAVNVEGEMYVWGATNSLGNQNARVHDSRREDDRDSDRDEESANDEGNRLQQYPQHPLRVQVGENAKIVQIACGDNTSYALDNDGKVNIWFTSMSIKKLY